MVLKIKIIPFYTYTKKMFFFFTVGQHNRYVKYTIDYVGDRTLELVTKKKTPTTRDEKSKRGRRHEDCRVSFVRDDSFIISSMHGLFF